MKIFGKNIFKRMVIRIKVLLYCSIFNHTLVYYSKDAKKCYYCKKIIKNIERWRPEYW